MKTILELVQSLKGRDVSELAVVSGRYPCVKVQGAYQPIDDAAASTATILRLLEALDGGRYVPTLGERPSQWRARVDGFGEVEVTAIRKGEAVQVRVTPVAPRASRRPPPKLPAEPRKPTPPPERPRKKSIAPLELDVSPPSTPRAREVAPPSTPQVRDVPRAPAMPKVDLGADDGGLELELDHSPRHAAVAHAPPPVAAGLVAGSLEIEAQRPAARHEPVAANRTTSADDALEHWLARARERRASDLHLVADRPALLRVAGELVADGAPLDARAIEAMLLPIVPARLRAALDADGACDFALAHARHGRFRVNVARQRTGYKGSFRVIASQIPTLAALGLPEELGQATHHHQGLIVVTGPTGHGKTTTLAALVDRINESTTHHVITVEDPVEYLHPRKRAMVSQREVGTHTRTFAAALKGSLRQDPDVIVVGELRDTETVRMALSASETGHLVLGTMNTPSAAKTIDRLIDLFPPGDQAQVRMTLAGGLRMIVSQRLVPNVDRTALVVAAEVLPGSIALWNLIRDNKTFQIPSLQQRGKSAGIVRLDDSLADLVRAGKSTLEAVLPFAEDPDELTVRLRPAAAPVEPAAKQAGLLARAGSLLGKR